MNSRSKKRDSSRAGRRSVNKSSRKGQTIKGSMRRKTGGEDQNKQVKWEKQDGTNESIGRRRRNMSRSRKSSSWNRSGSRSRCKDRRIRGSVRG